MPANGIPLDKAKEYIRQVIVQHKMIEQGDCLSPEQLGEIRILIREFEEVLRILPIDTDEHEKR